MLRHTELLKKIASKIKWLINSHEKCVFVRNVFLPQSYPLLSMITACTAVSVSSMSDFAEKARFRCERKHH